VYDFLDDAACSSDSDILVAAGTVLVQLQPVFDATFAEELVAVVALLGLPAYFEADLAQNKSSELFAYLESTDTVRIVAYRSKHLSQIWL